MSGDDSFHWLGVIGTAMVIISYLPQIRHLWVERCGAGISLEAYTLWCSASALLFVYAVIAEEPVFMALQGYHAVACALILGLSIKYRTSSRCQVHQ